MSTLLDSLAAGFDGDGARRAALDDVLRDGLPHARSEAWKYTPLRTLERRMFSTQASGTPAAFDAALIAGVPAPRLVFVNGNYDAVNSDTSGMCAGVDLRPLSRASDDGAPGATQPRGRALRGADEVFARLNEIGRAHV